MNNPLHFLIIDDNSIDRMIARKMLQKSMGNVVIYEADSSNEGIKWINKNRASVNDKLIILLDMQMPDVDGFGFLASYDELNDSVKKNNILFMLSSMNEGNDFFERAINNLHVKSVLSKPIDTEELLSLI